MTRNGGGFLEHLSGEFDVQLVYAFGSRAGEVLAWAQGQTVAPLTGSSDVDIGVKTRHPLSVEQKVRIAIAFEDALGVGRVDVVCLEDADSVLAANIIRGELLYTSDLRLSDEYELYVLRRADDVAPLERDRIALILGSDT